ncbi:small ribosomal subunit protein mS23 [Leptinotarsa decemlineata]|uniref:small ribosomal subunit protein mS23 n=1 Tax=Leptinotarsa decemlineata TaxID=7539 RepID=UPI003D306948
MAGSRLEKIGTIYTRTTGLLRSGALSWEDRPLWYDIYEAFPPKDEPKFDRVVPNIKLKKIFYEEDKIRAMFQRNNKQNLGSTNLFNENYQSLTQKFLEIHQKIHKQYDGDMTPEQMYKAAIEILKSERTGKTEDKDQVNLSTAFKDALSDHSKEKKVDISIANIFK